jgi:uncharacterized protein YukE
MEQPAMQDILVPVSPGELLDKITILRIKSQRIEDATKLQNVRVELTLLEQTWQSSGCTAVNLHTEEHALQAINQKLWDIEDQIRDKEARQLFDQGFIELARAVYIANDERASLKKRINTKLGSRLVEEKSYRPYRAKEYSAPQ